MQTNRRWNVCCTVCLRCDLIDFISLQGIWIQDIEVRCLWIIFFNHFPVRGLMLKIWKNRRKIDLYVLLVSLHKKNHAWLWKKFMKKFQLRDYSVVRTWQQTTLLRWAGTPERSTSLTTSRTFLAGGMKTFKKHWLGTVLGGIIPYHPKNRLELCDVACFQQIQQVLYQTTSFW